MQQYLTLLDKILKEGQLKHNRTGIDTISYFGYQMRFDLTQGFPLLTTKKVFYKAIIHELIWFLNGDTNIKYLVDNNVKIWNEWAFLNFTKSRAYQNESLAEFVEKIHNDANFAKIHGELGPIYGKQWRDFNGIDQIKNLLDEIKNHPNSRRLIISAWNPAQVKAMALPPCHVLFQFYVDDQQNLSCQLYQRSGDVFLGIPFNIASYALLVHMIASMCDLKPKDFVHTIGDAHIYVNHLEQVKLQLSRTPRKLPQLIIKRIPSKIEDFKFEDFEIIDYDPAPMIKGEVAV